MKSNIFTKLSLCCLFFLTVLTMNVSGQATVTTDKPDYAPLSNAVFTGSGFLPGEYVILKVKNLFRPCNTTSADSSYFPWTVTADSLGGFVTNWTVCNCPGDSLRLKATGQTSGYIATALFSDGVITPFSAAAGVIPISTDKAVGGPSPAYTVLTGALKYTANAGDGINQPSRTVVLSAPANWQFKPGVGSISATGSFFVLDLVSPIVVTSSTITIKYSTTTSPSSSSFLTISGIEVQATSGVLTAINILRTGGDAVTGTGWGINTTNCGTLSQKGGTVNNFIFNTITSPKTQGSPFSVTITAKDVFGNTSNGFTGTANLSTNAGPSAISPSVTGTFSGGAGSSETLNVTLNKSGFGITITATSLTPSANGTSNSFTVESNEHFQSKGSGNWNDINTWESSPDGIIPYQPATMFPAFGAKTIKIRSGHTVTVATDVTVDEVTVNSGGQITVNNGVDFILNNGMGTDLNNAGIVIVNGSVSSFGTTGLSIVTSGSMVINGILTMSDPNPSVILDAGGVVTINGSVQMTGGNPDFIVNASSNLNIVSGTLNLGSISNLQVTGTISMSGNSLLKVFRGNGGNVMVVNSGGKVFMSDDATISTNGSDGAIVNFLSGSFLKMGSSTVINGAGQFTLASGASMEIGSPNGIWLVGTNSGNIQTTGTSNGNLRSFSPGANYTYNGTAAQVTGSGLPATVNSLTISNLAGVTLPSAKVVTNTLSITAGALNLGTFTHTAGSLTLGVTGAVNGAWGSTASLLATYKNNTYFNVAGTGVVNVTLNNCTPPSAPAVTTPICTGATSVSGTSTEADGTTITVYKGGSSVGTTTVSSGTWTLTGLAALANGNVIDAKASGLGGCLSDLSNSVTVASCAFIINASAGTGGTISPSGAVSVTAGANQTFNIAANACYTIADVTVDGSSVGAVSSYTFTNVTTTHSITATFALQTYSISVTQTTGGTIAPGTTSVNCGANQTFSITPGSCYTIADVTVDGSSVGAVSSYTFTNVTISHSITATYTLKTYSIAVTQTTGGTIAPGTTSVNCGADQTFSITPGSCYTIADVTVDGASVGAVSSYTFTNVQAAHSISATFSLKTYTITSSAGTNGSISPNGATSVNCGESQTYTFTPVDCYQVAMVLVDGVNNPGAVSSGSYTFTNVTTAHTISVSFAVKSYTIVSSAGPNGSISPSGFTNVICDASQTYTITPDACYQIATVLVDGVNDPGAVSSGSYTFSDVRASHSIEATFSLKTYTIASSAGANGTISPDGNTSVNCGGSQAYTITPNAIYQIADVLVDGVSNPGAVSSGSYTFTNVTTTHTISASFALKTYNITSSAGANGTISPSGNTSVNCGANQTYTITPNACYQIADVLVDGVSNAGAISSGSYTFTNVTTTHAISATFALKTYNIASSAGANGSISPSGNTSVNCGGSQTYTFTPVDCYQVAMVLVDGVNNPGAVSSGSYTFTNVTTAHTISVSFAVKSYTIVSSAGSNGSISPDGFTNVICAASQTYTITPDACYQIATVLVDGVNNPGAVSSGSYTFTNVRESHTIEATFSLKTYTITSSAGANGSISPSGNTSVNCGANQAYTITPNACYQIADVLVDGVSNAGAISSGSYTFNNVTVSHTISATFALKTYTITSSAGANGTISPDGNTSVNCGASQAYTITPAGCYQIATVLVDGVNNPGAVSSGSYTFTNVTTAHTISATFSLKTYTITSSAGANGSISPSGATSVNCGGSQTYTFTPVDCYQVAMVLVDGVNNPGAVSSGSYTFTNVTTAHTISVSFAVKSYTIVSSAGPNGSISPSGFTNVICDASQTYTITPDACYQIATVLVDGVNDPGAVSSGSYTFSDVRASHSIEATFSLKTYTIASSAGANGTISPDGNTSVNCGASQAYTITPAGCYQIATVLVDGVNNPGAVSTGSYTFTNVTVGHTISASFALKTYNIASSAGANGSISPSGNTSVNCGANQTYTITPNACYQIADVLVDGVSNAVAVSSGSYTFTNVNTTHTISATFALKTYNIASSAGANGTISPSGNTSVNCGANQTYTVTPNACYQIADVLVDGVSNAGAVSSGSYTFTNVTTTHTISATFALKTYNIASSAGANGTISPNGNTSVNCGANQTYTITPNACYQIADVLVDGVSNAGAISSGSYTFTNVTTTHTISATFSLKTYTITSSAGANGSISPNGATSVNCGGSQTYTFTPVDCYQVAMVLVDGVNNPGAVSSGSYTFTNVTTAHTISVSFAVKSYTIVSSAGSNGSISPSGFTNVICDASQTYTITPDACYQIATVLVDGVNNPGAVSSGSYTFTNVRASQSIEATFSLKTYTITSSAGANGTISANGATSVNCGASQAYTVTPAACYQIATVLVDGVNNPGAVSSGSYTFTNVTTAHTISATFSLKTYAITVTQTTGGTIAPGTTTLNCGANQAFSITPGSCYNIADVTVDGSSVGPVTSYTFTNVTAAHSITATYTLKTYNITVTQTTGGTIAPGTTTVNCGANQTFSITAAACNHITDVVVDGVSVGPISTYTFSNVTAAHSITATYAVTTTSIDASASSAPIPKNSMVVFKATVYPAVENVWVYFYLDGLFKCKDQTDASGFATCSVAGPTMPEVYVVKAVAGGDGTSGSGCQESTAYLAVYDPAGGFVTGGGWIWSGAGSYIPNPSLEGKANFGFVSKYKKGSSTPEGNTEFQFKAGSLNFSSTMYNSGSLVIAGSKAIYKGVGTINGAGNYGFMVSAVDGQINGGGGTDKFRMRIWNRNNNGSDSLVYDNNLTVDENLPATTVLGGGSIVIHQPSGGNSARGVTTEITDAPVEKATAPVIAEQFFGITVIGANPTSSEFILKLQSPVKEMFEVNIINQHGSIVQVIKAQAAQTIRFGNNYARGTYMARVRQAGKSKVVKLLKL